MKVKNIPFYEHITWDILFALIDHFAYSIRDINDYSELAEEEKNIISEDTWNKITCKS